MIIISFGITKAIIAYRGQSIAPTTLELVVGTVLAAVLYWIGLYEAKKFEWLLQVDMAPAIGYSIKRFIGGVLGVLFGGDGMLIIIWLSTLPVIPFVCFSGFVLRRSVGAWVYNFLTVFGLIFWRSTRTRRVRGRTQLWGWQGVMGFLAEYGPTAPLAEQYGRLSWFGAVGTVVGLLCGITLYLSPQAVFYFEGLYICRQERLTTPLQQEISDL
ncbi:hypothetical protein EI94DRAFT_1729454 [Lactarius quietus]|nr:hypothetical protein EI94DRAFT_1729454 [Lactarius quietus]